MKEFFKEPINYDDFYREPIRETYRREEGCNVFSEPLTEVDFYPDAGHPLGEILPSIDERKLNLEGDKSSGFFFENNVSSSDGLITENSKQSIKEKIFSKMNLTEKPKLRVKRKEN